MFLINSAQGDHEDTHFAQLFQGLHNLTCTVESRNQKGQKDDIVGSSKHTQRQLYEFLEQRHNDWLSPSIPSRSLDEGCAIAD
jgi:hypothetical protein